MFRTLALLALAAGVLTGCGGPGCEGSGCSDGPIEPHFHPFTRTDSDVTVLPTLDGRFRASQLVTLSGDHAWATGARISVWNQVGSITSTGAAGSAYQFQVALRADAPTEAAARAALTTISIRHGSEIGEELLYLDHEIEFVGDEDGNVDRGADVTISLPMALAYGLSQYTGTGTVSTSGLAGPGVALETGTGNVSLSGTWDEAEARGGTGTLTVGGDIADLIAYVDTGDVNAALPGTRGTQATLNSNTGDVDVTVGRTAATVFDLAGSATVGSATIVVAGTQPAGTQTPNQAHYRSPGYDTGSPQVQVDASTLVGSVLIHE